MSLIKLTKSGYIACCDGRNLEI